MESTGLELLLNACEGVVQIVVTKGERLLAVQEWHLPKQGAEILAPALEGICSGLGIKTADFRRIGCFRGPGSFTGIRLVLSTASALRRTGMARLAALDYMQALATSISLRRGLLFGAHLWVVTHARRDLVHCQPFVSYGTKIPAQPLRAVELMPPTSVLAQLAETPGHVCGSGLARYPELFAAERTGQGPAGAPDAVPMPELVNPDVSALCLLGRHGDYFPKDVEPLYVRPCDAVENLPDLAVRQGLDGDAAVCALDAMLRSAPESVL